MELELSIVVLAVLLQTLLGWRWFLIGAGALWWLAGRSRWLAVMLVVVGVAN